MYKRQTYIDVLTPLPRKEFWNIAELKEGMKNISVQGTVTTKPLVRKVKTTKGEIVNLTVFEIKDETGSIWVSAWRKNAEKTANLKPDEKIAIKNADVKRGFADQLEITTRNTTVVEILSKHQAFSNSSLSSPALSDGFKPKGAPNYSKAQRKPEEENKHLNSV